MRQARGVLPKKDGSVIKNPNANGYFVFVKLRADIDLVGVRSWLDKVDPLARGVREIRDANGDRAASVAVGFSPAFFGPVGAPRFPDVEPPAGFAALPPVPAGPQVDADVVFYLMTTRESLAAQVIEGLWKMRPDVTSVLVERGFQRSDGTEPFGYKDGVRNVARNARGKVVYVDRDRFPEEPPWAENGTYLAFMRITQNVDMFNTIAPDEQDRIVGRTRDGRRLDLPIGSDTRTEPEMAPDVPPLSSHVRHAGPRGAGRDEIQIFRRGLPFIETGTDGTVRTGLQFASFQASLDHFRVVFNRWMLNRNFPPPGSGRQDELFERGLVTIDRWGFFVVPGDSDAPLGTEMLMPAKDAKPHKPKTGKVAVRKRVLDSNGVEADADLAGFSFQVVDVSGQPVGAPFTTNPAGHAMSDNLPTETDLVLQELPPPAPLQPAQARPFRLESSRLVLRVDNTTPAGTVYGG